MPSSFLGYIEDTAFFPVSVRATAGFFLEAGQDSSPEPGGPGGRDAQSEWKIAGQEVDDVLLDDASRENGHDGGEILDGVDAADAHEPKSERR